MNAKLLKHITFTGVDEFTNLQRLEDIQRRFPLAEFGVLLSEDWQDNGPRFPDPKILPHLLGRGLNLSAHLCGDAAMKAAFGLWYKIDENLFGGTGIRTGFQRIQLNISTRSGLPTRLSTSLPGQEIIIQQKDATHANFFHASKILCNPISVLLDASGGRGIDTPIDVRPEMKACKVGYAGGFGPDNAAAKLRQILQNPNTGAFWIDMESRVRTDDKFDLDKVEAVLKECYKILDS